MLLYDNKTKTYNSNIVRYIAPGETSTLTQLDLYASFISPYTILQNMTWTSLNPSYVSVDPNTGAITGLTPGKTANIAVSITANSSTYVRSFTVHVTLIPNGTYFIRNKASGKYIDIQNRTMANGTPLLQWDFHGEASEKWTFRHLANGAYSIKSENALPAYYMGVKDHTSALNQPVLLRTGSAGSTAALQWQVSLTSSGAYKLTPMDSDGYVLAMYTSGGSAVTDNDNLLRLQTYTADTNYTDEWEICYANVLNLNVLYDAAYVDRYGSSSAAQAEVSAQLETLQEVFQDLFSIQVTYNTPSQYATYANINCTTSASGTCNHGTCANSTSSSLAEFHHTNITNIFHRLSTPAFPISANVLYIGHETCGYDGTECKIHPLDGIANANLRKVAINNFTSTLNCTQTLIHEVGHLFGAPDHYEGSGTSARELNDQFDCDLFDEFCMYGSESYKSDVKDNHIICAGCQAMIEANASRFFVSQ